MTGTKKDDAQKCLRSYLRVDAGLTDKRAVGDGIIERKRLFQM